MKWGLTDRAFKLHQFGFLRSLTYYKAIPSTVLRNRIYFLTNLGSELKQKQSSFAARIGL